jgi:hypothetical protein
MTRRPSMNADQFDRFTKALATPQSSFDRFSKALSALTGTGDSCEDNCNRAYEECMDGCDPDAMCGMGCAVAHTICEKMC